MRKKIFILLAGVLLSFGISQNLLAQNISSVPAQVRFANVQINLNEDARRQVSKKIEYIQSDAKFLETMREKVFTFMPVVMKNLKEQGVHEDLAYLALKETEFLQSSADDRKLPAGVWRITPNQNEDWKLNLQVTGKIDERKHLGISTIAVATKLKNDNYNLQNWINTVLAYGFGFHEVSQTSSPDDKGSNKYDFHGQTNPYLIELVAYYLVFKPEFKPSENSVTLLEYPDTKGKDLEKLANMVGVSLVQLKLYNTWLTSKSVPKDKDYIVYFPAKLAQKAEIENALTKNNTKLPTSTPQQLNYPIIVKKQTVNVEAKVYDLVTANGLNAIMVSSKDKADNMIKIANTISLRKFLKYNEISEETEILPNTIYYLEEKKDKAPVKYHRLKEGETHWNISQMYGIKNSKLLAYNRIKKGEKEEVGHNLWLDSERPKDVEKDVRVMPKEVQKDKISTTDNTVLAAAGREGEGFSEDEKGKYYTNTSNELIYDLAAKLGVRIDSLHSLNPELGNAMNIPANTKLMIATKKVATVAPTIAKTDSIKTAATSEAVKSVAENVIKEKEKNNAATQTKMPTEITHTIVAGDNLRKIAEQYGVKKEDIMTANKIQDANKIAKGQRLIIKNPTKGVEGATLPAANNTSVASNTNTPAVKTTPAVQEPKVKKDTTLKFVEQPFLKDSIYLVRNDGETYLSIEKKLGLKPINGFEYSLYMKTWNTNNLDPNLPPIEVNQPLTKGTTIKLAENAVLPSSADVAKAMNVDVNAKPDKQVVTEVVNNTSTTPTNTTAKQDTTKQTNTVPNIVTANTEVVVRYEDYKDSVYIVEAGDWLYKIAKKTGVPNYRYLMVWNNITEDNKKLDIGDRIIVKGDLSKPLVSKPITKGNYHLTQFGENIYDIAKYYGTKSDSLVKWNKLANDSLLPIGKSLLVKQPETTRTQWAAATGKDTKVAMRGNTAADNVKNNMNSGLHKDIYLVRENNETLKSIAEKLKLADVSGVPYYLHMKTWNNIEDENQVIAKGTAIKISDDAVAPTPQQIQAAMQSGNVDKNTTATTEKQGVISQSAVTTQQQPKYTTAQPFKDVYVVRLPNETLKNISEKHNFQPIAGADYYLYMKSWNAIDDENMALPIGKAIRLTETATLPNEGEIAQLIPPSSANFDGKHTVAKGETLRTIAKQYNVDVKYLEEWNKMDDSTPLTEGQTLIVQGDMRTEVREYDKFYTDRYHVVQRGETLSDIARFHKVTVENLITWNGLESNVLKESQILWIIPKPKIHKVMHGESLSVVAAMYSLSVQDIADFNNVPVDYKTKQGEMLIVDVSAILPKPMEKQEDYSVNPPQTGREVEVMQSNPNAPETYYAQFGETVTMVCTRYSVSKIDFRLWNKLSYNTENLEEGKKYYLRMPKVEIPPSSGTPSGNGKYKVGKNETLYSIARKFNVSIYQLREWNNLKKDAVKEGDNLIVNKQ